ncbi:MAG TPA: NlpC/P60 family protein [Urbifossiella sp.]|nr:NlpC/P60 family protein [Urbifossiella sp.]
MANYEITEVARSWKHTPYKYGGDSNDGIDCSHFVWEVLKASGHPSAPYVTTSAIRYSYAYAGLSGLPSNGDIILFDGHMGIVIDATNQIFIGAQSGGVDAASYSRSSYWGKQKHDFYRYVGP